MGADTERLEARKYSWVDNEGRGAERMARMLRDIHLDWLAVRLEAFSWSQAEPRYRTNAANDDVAGPARNA